MRSNVCHSSGACNAQIQHTGGQWQSAEYWTFSISDEAGKYRLSVSGYSGDAGDAMTGLSPATRNADGMMFSTPDQDNDLNPEFNRAAYYNGCGWWFGGYSRSRLNYDNTAMWMTANADVQFSRMLVRAN